MFRLCIRYSAISGLCELFTTLFHQLSRKFHQFRKFHDVFCFSGFRMFAAMVASTTHRRHLMVQKIFTPRFIFEAAGFGVSLATMCLSYLTFVRIRGSISKYVKALWLEIIRINTQSNIVLTIYIPNVWYIKNQTKLSNVFLLCLVWFLMHQTLASLLLIRFVY